MAYSIRYDSALNIIRIKLKTAIDAALARTITLDAMALARNHNCKALLVDFRATAVAEKTMGIYEFATSLPDLGVDPAVRFAGVLSQDDPDHRFFETVAKNRGFDVRYFTDVSAAERWLAQGGPSPAGGRTNLEKASH